MTDIYTSIITPSQPTVIEEGEDRGIYEIERLYPGYGHTLGNSLRRIILSSLPGVAITTVKIDDVSHEFSTIEGIQEDVIAILLNLRKVRMRVFSEGAQTISISKKGQGTLTAGDLGAANSAVEVVNPDQHIATLTDKKSSITMEVTVEQGLGFITKEDLKKDKVDIGVIALDAVFTPIRRVSYEVENMRVGDRTDFNKLRIFIETDGIIAPREALESAVEIMIQQLQAIRGVREDATVASAELELEPSGAAEEEVSSENAEEDILKTRVESLGISTRALKALSGANIRTVGGLIRKKEQDLLELEGLGDKGVEEIKDILAKNGLSLKEA